MEPDEQSQLPRERIKLQVFDEAGQLLLDLGAHVVAECPPVAAKIGELAAEWAHAEAEMAALLAALMDTEPERTFALMAVYRSAANTAEAARGLAKATLLGPQLTEMLDLISRFEATARGRNDVQHGLWARKGNNADQLFRLKALQYTQFMVRFSQTDDRIRLSMDFAAGMDDAYTVQRLASMADEIRHITADIFKTRMQWSQTKGLRRILNGFGFGGKI